ncbi:hypothetical protein D9619_013399 [Psilocybe cf. subviscida]|uniref:Tat pathway signal sequence n=1 Tax=Psilocybe cf. subviscida TaxID=2480587 RepID=A0A8H5BS51_9AGAR|nr:hypothetical protein D9619_013399 [Psilocybe cf. subviscida]
MSLPCVHRGPTDKVPITSHHSQFIQIQICISFILQGNGLTYNTNRWCYPPHLERKNMLPFITSATQGNLLHLSLPVSSKESYHLLADDEDSRHAPRLSLVRRFAGVYLTACLAIIFAQTVTIVLLLSQKSTPGPYLYFPAEEAVQYEIKTFTFGISNDISPYQGSPSPEVDHLWEELYSVGFQRIPKSDAARLPNKTAPIPGDPEGFYITELDVFHQLHCLNFIRKALHPNYYPAQRLGTPENNLHVSHCVDSIRQSLMCSADISTVVWQWDAAQQNNTFQGEIAHKCRNFGMIQDWARERAIPSHYDSSIHIEDNLRIPIYHSDGSSYFS